MEAGKSTSGAETRQYGAPYGAIRQRWQAYSQENPLNISSAGPYPKRTHVVG